MASTYSDRLKLELMETGANANTLGNNTNTNLETLDAFSSGYLSKSVAGSANVTLTTNNADPTAEASNKVLDLNGTLTGDIHVFLPATESFYTVFNNTSGSFSLTVAATGHAANGVAITQGTKAVVYCDGASNYNVKIASGTDAALLDAGTVSDSRLSANVTLNNASTISAGTLPDARFPATLPQVSGANLTDLAAGNVASGTLSSDRLPTVPTTKGGTGLTSIGSAGQVLTVASPGSALEFADAGGGGYNLVVYNSPATYAPPADLHSVKVTVVAGGGGGGGATSDAGGAPGGGGAAAIEHIPAASMPGPVSVTVGSAGSAGNGISGNSGTAPSGGAGGTSSFGAFLSATAGNGGGGAVGGAPGTGGNGGSPTGGDININGSTGGGAGRKDFYSADGPVFGSGGIAGGNNGGTGTAGTGNGSGGGGGGRSNNPGTAGDAGGVGAPGTVIIEEYLG